MIRLFSDLNNQFCDDNGDPVALGTVKFFEPGTTTLVTTYPTRAAAVAQSGGNATTITLNAAGRPASGGSEHAIWLNGDADVKVYDADGVLVRSLAKVNTDSSTADASEGLANPSFEDALTGTWKAYKSDGITDGVENTDYVLDTTNNAHGSKALKLIDGAIAVSKWSGGGALIPHSPDDDLNLEMFARAGSATDLVRVTVKQYDKDGGDLGADINIVSSSSGNPTSFEKFGGAIAASSLNASMRYYSVVLKGGSAAGQYAWFDGISLKSASLAPQAAPTGAVTPFAGAAAPAGWLLCQGQAISRTAYKKLFDVLGTTFGAGDGSTTFNLPNMEGRFPIGKSGTYALGATGGAESKTITADNLPDHDHKVLDVNADGVASPNATPGLTGGGAIYAVEYQAGDFQATSGTFNPDNAGVGSAVANSALDIRNPYLSLNYIIKA